jgi:hypothetical protein
MKKISLLLFLIVSISFCGCKRKVNPTWVHVPDSVRHYYPMTMGESITMVYEIQNVGKEPLIISDIQPSCGCIINLQKDNVIIFPGKNKKLTFHFNSSANEGYVQQTIRIYGNVLPHGEIDLVFDTNVVPSSAEGSEDYEILYDQKFKNDAADGIKDAVNGKREYRDYYVDSDDAYQ